MARGRGRTYTLSAAMYRKSGLKNLNTYVRLDLMLSSRSKWYLSLLRPMAKLSVQMSWTCCHLDRNQAYRLLNRMKESGQINQVGEQKGAVYELP